ncbi:hypothetical protein Dsin_003293 [Dipteronia sinensis]|uniref:Small auxin up regulated protein n=1 Tax=Dipteronia sinensis TaxID=43782 RepID=A0AAE0EKT0_9ROSI|nr:hypothetical protein Dsin_003293 [Dipteronia sinensis]
MARKGHFVVYLADQTQLVIPVKYLENNIIRELLKIAEDEFGLPCNGPITLPCDAVFMEYAISLQVAVYHLHISTIKSKITNNHR